MNSSDEHCRSLQLRKETANRRQEEWVVLEVLRPRPRRNRQSWHVQHNDLQGMAKQCHLLLQSLSQHQVDRSQMLHRLA